MLKTYINIPFIGDYNAKVSDKYGILHACGGNMFRFSFFLFLLCEKIIIP